MNVPKAGPLFIAAVIGAGAALLLTGKLVGREAEAARAPQLSTRAPNLVTHSTEYGQVIVLDVPVNDLKRATERQTCVVWRDRDYQSASLSCPNDRSTYTLDPP